MATSESCGSISYPFPQPSRPSHAHIASIESMEDETKQDCDTFTNHQEYPMLYRSEEENMMSADDDEQDDDRESPKILRKLRKKLDEQGHFMHKKLHFKLRRDRSIDTKLGETLHDLKGRVVSDLFEKSSTSDPEASNDDMNAERGIDISDILSSNQGGMEEPKLERFKVRAVNIVGVGVVKEED